MSPLYDKSVRLLIKDMVQAMRLKKRDIDLIIFDDTDS